MKINIYLLLLFLGISANLISQESGNYNEPSESQKEAYTQKHISKIIRTSKTDSIRIYLNNIKLYCQETEPIYRLGILLDISENKLIDSTFSDKSFNYLTNYLYRLNSLQKSDSARLEEYIVNKAYYGFTPIGGILDNYTKTFAESLVKRSDINLYDKIFLALYTNDKTLFLNLLNSNEYHGTTIQNSYNETINNFRKMPDGNIAIGAGIWMPVGVLSFLGPHPFAKIDLGINGKILSSNISIQCRFTESKNSYIVDSVNKLTDTLRSRRHFSAYLGFEPGFNLIKKEKIEFSIISGIGLDVFKAFYPQDYPEGTEENDANPISFSALNLNLGLSLKLKNPRGGYWGFSARYEFLNYENPRGSDLSGDAISFSISRGILENSVKKQNLEFWKN